MSLDARILECLQNHPEGLDDDDLSIILGFNSRQQANQYCRKLEAKGYLQRVKQNGKKRNFYQGHQIGIDQLPIEQKGELSVEEYHMKWYWEGNVQLTVVDFLLGKGWSIKQAVSTSTHEKGIDIIAEKDDISLWVTVKGYPRKKIKTNPRLQCVHWFSSALYDIIKYRERNAEVELAFALPDFERYRNLVKEITWFKAVSKFNFFWVNEKCEIEIE